MMRLGKNPVEIDGAVRARDDRCAFWLPSVVVAPGEARVSFFVPEHIPRERDSRIAQELTALIIEDFGFRGDRLANALENGNAILATGGIVAEHGMGSTGAQDCDGLQVFAKRQGLMIILEERHTLQGNRAGELQMFRCMDKAFLTAFIHVRVFKQPQQELDFQHASAGLTDHAFVQASAFHKVPETILPLIMLKVVQLQVHTGFKAQCHGLFLGFSKEMPVIEAGNGREIGAHKSAHAPLSAQDIRQQLMVGGYRRAVHGAVGAHRVDCACVGKGRFKHRHGVGKHLMSSHSARSTVQPAHRSAVGSVMLGLSRNGIRIRKVFALHAFDHFSGKGSAEIGIFAIGFLGASIPRIPDEIHHRAVGLMNAHGAGLRADHPAHFSSQIRFKACCQTDLLGKCGGIEMAQPVEGFLAEQKRNAQTRFFNGVALQLIDLGRRHAAGLNAADTVAMEQAVQLIQVDGRDGFIRPALSKVRAEVLVGLQDHLLKGHSVQKILNAFVDVQTGIAVIVHSR